MKITHYLISESEKFLREKKTETSESLLIKFFYNIKYIYIFN